MTAPGLLLHPAPSAASSKRATALRANDQHPCECCFSSVVVSVSARPASLCVYVFVLQNVRASGVRHSLIHDSFVTSRGPNEMQTDRLQTISALVPCQCRRQPGWSAPLLRTTVDVLLRCFIVSCSVAFSSAVIGALISHCLDSEVFLTVAFSKPTMHSYTSPAGRLHT